MALNQLTTRCVHHVWWVNRQSAIRKI